MSDRLTPETDREWDRLQMLPGGGYSSQVAGVKLAFGMGRWASELERQRDEARDQLTRICREGFGYQDTVSLEPCADYVLRKLKEERELARELRVHLMNLVDQEPCKCCYDDEAETDWVEAKSLLTKAKEVLP